jgi:hypothetical protein
LRSGVNPLSLAWLTDLVPALVLAATAAAMTVSALILRRSHELDTLAVNSGELDRH